jgi:hypothetical protein
MTTRLCTKCGLEKDINEFSWSIRGVKRHSRCKSCHAEEKKDYYERNKEKVMEYKWDRQIRKREEARAFVWEYLKNHPCEHCHEADPTVLTFHHVEGIKRMNVAELVNRGYLLEVIREEIALFSVLIAIYEKKKEFEVQNTNSSCRSMLPWKKQATSSSALRSQLFQPLNLIVSLGRSSPTTLTANG